MDIKCNIKLGDLVKIITTEDATLMVCYPNRDKCVTLYHGTAGFFMEAIAPTDLGKILTNLDVTGINSYEDDEDFLSLPRKTVICISVDSVDFAIGDSHTKRFTVGRAHHRYSNVVHAIIDAMSIQDLKIAATPDDYTAYSNEGKEIHGFIDGDCVFIHGVPMDAIGTATIEGFSRDDLLQYMKVNSILRPGKDGYYVIRDDAKGYAFYQLSMVELGVKVEYPADDTPNNHPSDTPSDDPFNGEKPIPQNYSSMTKFHITRYFAEWASRAKPSTITTAQFVDMFGVGAVKARKVMDHLVSIGLMKAADTKCKPRSVDVDAVAAYQVRMSGYERCQFCVNYGESPLSPKAKCSCTGQSVIGEILVSTSKCTDFFMDENKVSDHNEFNGIGAP